MASPPRTAEREEERRLNARTLAIASTAAASAALITSQLWIAGTWIAAAMTPVIVALVSEMLRRPTEKIARTLTTERTATLPEAGGAAPPARPQADPLPRRVPEEPGAGAGRAQPPAPVTVYRAGESGPRRTVAPASGRPGTSASRPVGRPPARRRRIAYGVVFGTAALAFVIAVLALTVPELIAGGSIGKNDGRTTLFGGGKKDSERDARAPQETTPEDDEQPEQDQPATPAEPEQTTPEEEPPPEETTPEAAPPGEPLPETTAPAPPGTP